MTYKRPLPLFLVGIVLAACALGAILEMTVAITDKHVDTTTLAIVNDIHAINAAGGPAMAVAETKDLFIKLDQARNYLKSYNGQDLTVTADGPGELLWQSNHKILEALNTYGPDLVRASLTGNDTTGGTAATFEAVSSRLETSLQEIRKDYRDRRNLPPGAMAIEFKNPK